MKNVLMVMTAFIFSMVMISGCATTTGRTAGEVVDDSVITSEVNAKIIKDPDLQFFKIDVDSREGNVTLNGKVPTRQAEDRLISLAREVKGVKSVKSNLTIEGTREGTWQGTREGTSTGTNGTTGTTGTEGTRY